MKKLFLLLSIAISGFGFSQTKITITRSGNTDTISSSDFTLLNQKMQIARYKSTLPIDIHSTENAVINLINQHRLKNGLPTLIKDSSLYPAVLLQSNYMLSVDSVTHYNSAPNLHTPAKRVDFYKKNTMYKGECCNGNSLYTCYLGGIEPADKIFITWKNSKPHNSILLSSNSTHIGVAISQNLKTGKLYSCLIVY
jgi:uncharacterized protein YkwD